MMILKNGMQVDEYSADYVGQKIVIGIDSSKSDTAIAVGDAYGNIIADYEIRGGGKATDVYDLCAFTRKQMKKLFDGADIQLVGIEDIITKKEKGYKGIEIHQSRYKITAVFDNFLFTFEEFFGIRPIRVNNWDWKSTILPEEYRKRTHDKGSKDWFADLGNRWAGRNDNVTDSVCILMYLYKRHKVKPIYTIKETAPNNASYEFMIVPSSFPTNETVREFAILNNDTIEHNVQTIAGALDVGQVGFVRVAIENVPIDWIFSEHLQITTDCRFNRVEDDVMFLIRRV